MKTQLVTPSSREEGAPGAGGRGGGKRAGQEAGEGEGGQEPLLLSLREGTGEAGQAGGGLARLDDFSRLLGRGAGPGVWPLALGDQGR